MASNLVWYRLRLYKVKTEQDLTKAFHEMDTQNDLKLINERALSIYKNKRIFNKVILATDNAFLLAELAVHLSQTQALELIKSDIFFARVIQDPKAVTYLDRIKKRQGEEMINRLCPRLVAGIDEQRKHKAVTTKPPNAAERQPLLESMGPFFPGYGYAPDNPRVTRHLVWKPGANQVFPLR